MTRWWAPLWGSPRGEKAEDSDEAQIEAIRRIRVDSPIEKDQDYGVDTSSREKLDRLNKDFVADDPELATSPKSIQLLEEAEAREYHQTRRRKYIR